jgi:6-pyruvoyltetrahydropterin/6-carboxytetrahydropterin synthase
MISLEVVTGLYKNLLYSTSTPKTGQSHPIPVMKWTVLLPMVELHRTVRININPSPRTSHSDAPIPPDRCPNGFAGKPSSRGLARYYEFDVVCRGPADPKTGYLVNIHEVDSAVRTIVVPRLIDACNHRPETDPAVLLPELFTGLDTQLNGIAHSIRWRLNPYYSISMLTNGRTSGHSSDDQPAPKALKLSHTTTNSPVVYLRQRFDFAASHRLHVPEMSDEANRKLFGKCNNPSYHGHNYQFEPCVAVTMDDEALASGASPFSLPELEQIADKHVVEAFDHLNLNVDTTEFAEGSGLNPSVENIAKVFFDRMAPAVASASERARLVSVTVWETDRTSCTYPGDAPA